MRRRAFLSLVGGAAASSLKAHAQQAGAVAKIGILYPGPEEIAKLRSVPLLAGLGREARAT
jgi:hypothetical protein